MLCLLATEPARASPMRGPAFGQVERVVDGDTVKVRVAIWIDQEIVVSVRLAGVDAPEIFRPACEAERARGREAKAFVEGFLSGGAVTLHDIEHDKYAGRVVARIESGGADLGDALLAAGLAAAERGAWC